MFSVTQFFNHERTIVDAVGQKGCNVQDIFYSSSFTFVPED